MIVEWQVLPFVHVHRRRNCNVRDGYGVASEPFRLRQLGVKDAGKSVPVGRFLCNDCCVRLGFQKRLDDVFNEIGITAREPGRCFPQ